MTRSTNSRRKYWAQIGKALLALAMLLALMAGQVGAQGGSIILDGVGDDWDPSWQVATDPLDVFLTETGLHPHDPDTYARTGYDATGLWARYQASDNRWYFRIDVDGRGGDSDSTWGTGPGDLGAGTHGPDDGPLVAGGFSDGDGLSLSEGYNLGFQFEGGSSGLTAYFGNSNPPILPGVISETTSLVGLGVYSTTVNPGIIEFSFARDDLFPSDTAHWELWIEAQLGDFEDRVSDDHVTATLVVALDLVASCPAAPIVVGDEATFPLDYAIPASAAQGASNVTLSAEVPPGTTFISASDGGTQAGGAITWNLGDLVPGDAGQVTFTLRIDDADADFTINSTMSSDEGLRFESQDECPLQQPTSTPSPTPSPSPTPTSTPPPPPPVVPEPPTVTLMLAGLSGLAGYVALQWRARRKQ